MPGQGQEPPRRLAREPKEPLKGARLHKALRWSLLAVAGLFVLYLGVVNALLRLGGLEHLIVNAGPEVRRVDVGSSYSLWPGRVRAKDLDFDYADGSIHLTITV